MRTGFENASASDRSRMVSLTSSVSSLFGGSVNISVTQTPISIAMPESAKAASKDQSATAPPMGADTAKPVKL